MKKVRCAWKGCWKNGIKRHGDGQYCSPHHKQVKGYGYEEVERAK